MTRSTGLSTPRGGRVTASISDTRSAELYRRALRVLPGGVNSPVRAMRSIGRDPLFVDHGEGAELFDVDVLDGRDDRHVLPELRADPLVVRADGVNR